MHRGPAGRVVAFVEAMAEGVSVQIGDAGPDAPLHQGDHAVLGVAPLPSRAIRARGRERLGSIHRVLVSFDEAAATSPAQGALQVTVNRCVSRFPSQALRHGDTVEVATPQGAVRCVLRIVEEGAPMPPPRLVERDWLAIWEDRILGRAHGVRRELVLERSGRVALLRHGDGGHPEDATVLREEKLLQAQLVAFTDLVAWARPDDLTPREWGATRAATVVFYGDRIQAVELSDTEIQGDRDPAADVVLEWMLSLARARREEVARWRPPPLPDRARRLDHRGAKLLTYTHWLTGDALRGHGERFTVYEGGHVIHGELRLDPRGREVPRGQREARLSGRQLESVQHALDSGLLSGEAAWSNPEHVGSTYQSLSIIDRHEGPRTIRTTTAGHAGGAVSDLMADMARIARALARER